MPDTPIDTLLAPFPLIKAWFAWEHEGRQPSLPRRKAAALLMLHHGRQIGNSVFSLHAIGKALGISAGALRVRNTESKFFTEKWEEASSFGYWVLSLHLDQTRALRSDVDELRRTIDHLAPYAARAIYEHAVCMNYDSLVEQYREDGHAEDVPLLPEIGARCASRGYGLPMSDLLMDAVATVLAKPEGARLCHGDELREALQRQTKSTTALREEVRELRAEIARLKQLIRKSSAG